MRQNRLSLRVFYILLLSIVLMFFHFRFWKGENVISWDITLYYSYLPALFIYDDIKVESQAFHEALSGRQFYTYEDIDGDRFIKMTSGLAYLYAPFFFLAHAYATIDTSFDANGFSLPYHLALLIATGFYTIMGFWFLRKVLLRFFTDKAVAVSLPVIYFGTNLLYYSLREPMSHAYNFFLLSLILYLYFRFMDKPGSRRVPLLGFLAGLLILIRPTNIIALLFPLVLFFTDARTGSTHYKKIPWILIFALISIMPQLCYWHYTTGEWVLYSYNDEKFFFTDPEIWKGLFSYRKGWIIYSPAVIFALIGFGFLYHQHKRVSLSLIFTLLMALWITFSWWCWWYGGGFGARPLIDFLPLVAFGFAAVFQALGQAPRWIRNSSYTVLFILCFLSVFYNKQYKSSIIHFDGMTKELFWEQFLIDHHVENYDEMVERPDYDAAKINAD